VVAPGRRGSQAGVTQVPKSQICPGAQHVPAHVVYVHAHAPDWQVPYAPQVCSWHFPPQPSLAPQLLPLQLGWQTHCPDTQRSSAPGQLAWQMLLAQQPLGHVVASHAQVAEDPVPVHCVPLGHFVPALPHTHEPPEQRFASSALHGAQAPPPVPHSVVVGVCTHDVPWQQPVGHELASQQLELPPMQAHRPWAVHVWSEVHALPVPHLHSPWLPQALARVMSHAVHPAPQWAGSESLTQAPAQLW
jgi:hypothetical protein